MLLKIIEDINKSLDNDCFITALALALTLPDICGKAKYPNEKRNNVRYINWYDECIGSHEQCTDDDAQMPYLSGEVVYQLRCSLLHQGNPNINKDKVKEEQCKIDRFILVTEKKKEWNNLTDSSTKIEIPDENKLEKAYYREYKVNVRRLCYILTACAEDYYNKNKAFFNFFNYEIVDMDEMYAPYREQQKASKEWAALLSEHIKNSSSEAN